MDKTNEGFFKRVYEVVETIPAGRVTSYGAIAEYLGSKGSARMVGWAMNNSHQQPGNIPAHRVVNRNGLLTGKQHFGNSNAMKQLLETLMSIDSSVKQSGYLEADYGLGVPDSPENTE